MDRNISIKSADCETFEEINFDLSRKEYVDDISSAIVFPYVNRNSKDNYFIDIFIWDRVFDMTLRFSFQDGEALLEEEEILFLNYTNLEDLSVGETLFLDFQKDINKVFSKWNFPDFSFQEIGNALKYIYYVSHHSCREILYKAGLCNIAANLDLIQNCDIYGSTPTKIIGHNISIKLLRMIENNPDLIGTCLSDEKSIIRSVNIYRNHSDFIGEEIPSIVQWNYLEELYDGVLIDQKFSNTVYKNLDNDKETLRLYLKYYELQEELKDIYKVKIPNSKKMMSTLLLLENIKYYKDNFRHLDSLIKNRKITDRQYEYYGESLFITLPNNALDLCVEGAAQRNCLLDYLEDHALGKTTVLFLRRKSKKSKSFISIEIISNRICQVLGKCNSPPDENVVQFVKEYAQEKNLVYNTI